MPPAPTAAQEWRQGWPIVLGAAIGSGLGIPLFFYSFSLFTLGMMRDFHVTRGEMANTQALIVAGALAAPLVGRLLDRYGFRRVFAVSTLIVVGAHILMATAVTDTWQFGAIAFVYGAAGIGCGPLVYTRPITAWFVKSRGLALGVAALGLAVTALVTPPLLAGLIAEQGWRSGYLALGALAALVGLPLTLWLVRDGPFDQAQDRPGDAASSEAVDTPHPSPSPKEEGFDVPHHLMNRDFWLLAAAMLCVAIPGAGLLSQLSPLVQEEGIGATLAALGVSAYAIGQVIGRLVAGWFLDRANPLRVAFFFTFMPALGFVMLAGAQLPLGAAIVAVALVGVQQGAEIDLFAWFVARRFGLARYGRVYGGVIAASWIGNAAGILTFGWLHDATRSYAVAEGVAAGLMMLGALLISSVTLPRTDAAKPHPA